jgi:hypothetical protein
MSTALLAKEDSAAAESAAELVVRPSACQLLDDQGSEQVAFDRKTVESLLSAGNFFWLDLDNPSENDFAILRDVFKFHPLAVEDSEQFIQRSKVDGYDDFVFTDIYGAGSDEDGLVEALLLLGPLPRHSASPGLSGLVGDPPAL